MRPARTFKARTMSRAETPRRPGVTLVELLVVIAILALLAGILLAAVQRVRLTATRTQCQNHLRQIGLAWQNHYAVHGYFPTGGIPWPFYPVTFTSPGSPATGGPGKDDQAGSWMYQILPYLEQEAAWRQASVSDKAEACSRVVGTPIPVYFCPTRPRPRTWEPPEKELPIPPIGLTRAGNDYAANGGTDHTHPAKFGLPPQPNGMLPDPTVHLGPPGKVLRASDVSDGLSNTLLVAERRLTPDRYTGPNDYNMHGYAQSGRETVITCTFGDEPLPPRYDRAPEPLGVRLQAGSAHPDVMNAALADGSVRTVSYSVSTTVWVLLGVRNDGRGVPGDY